MGVVSASHLNVFRVQHSGTGEGCYRCVSGGSNEGRSRTLAARAQTSPAVTKPACGNLVIPSTHRPSAEAAQEGHEEQCGWKTCRVGKSHKAFKQKQGF